MKAKLFDPPQAQSEFDPGFARMVIILQIIALAVLLAVIIIINTFSQLAYATWILAILFLLVLLSLGFAIRGILAPGRILVPVSLIAAITAILYKGNGMHDTAIVGFPAAVVLGGMLVGRKGLWPLAFLSIGAITFIAVGEMTGLINSPYSIDTGWDDVLINAALLAASAGTLNLLMKRMNESLMRAQANERALQVSEEKFSKAFRSSPIAIMMVGLESGLVLEVNKSFERIFGHPRRIAIGQNIINLNIYDDPQDNLTLKSILIEKGHFENKELIGRRSNGNTLHVRASAEITEIKGELCVISTLEDITESKNIEAAMRRSEDLYRRAITTAGAVPYYLDHRTRTYTFMGEGIFQMTGYSVAEMDPDLWETLEQEGFPRGGLAHLTYEEADELTEEDSSIPWECDYRILTRDGQTRWVADTSVKGFNEYGEFVGVIGILQDVTERKQALFDRERLIAELGTRNAELERYSYTLSHELKTPLVTLAAYSEMLEKDISMGNTERIKSDLARIRRATDKMHKMIKELLELSRIGRIINTPQDVPFDEIVRDGLSAVEGDIHAKKVQIQIEPNLPMVHGDRIRLVEVIQNLVDNAIKYMGDQPEPRINIGTHGRDENGHLTFFVKDNGMGIDKGYHQRVFGMFEKLNPQSEGTGIGLALIKRIVEVHGGRIWVVSGGPGTGSTFLFTLAEKS